MSQTQRRSSRTANRQTGTTRPPKSLGKNISTTLTTALLATALATPVLAQEKNGTLVPAPSKHSATNSVLAQGDSVHRFDIRPQALIPALIAYGEAADVQLVFDSQLARNLETPGVTGTMPDREALQRLLAGTGLHSALPTTRQSPWPGHLTTAAKRYSARSRSKARALRPGDRSTAMSPRAAP